MVGFPGQQSRIRGGGMGMNGAVLCSAPSLICLTARSQWTSFHAQPTDACLRNRTLDLRRLWVLEARDRSVSVLAPHGVLRSRLVGAERGALDLVRAVHCERSPTDGAVAAGEPGFSHRSAPVAVRCKAPRRTPPGNQEAADSAQRGEPNRSLHLTASTSVLFSSPVVSTGNWFPGGR